MRISLAAVLIAGCFTVHRAIPQARTGRPHYTDVAGRSTFSYITNNGFTGRKYFPQPLCGGVAVLDYDNDGWPDILLTNGASFPDMRKTDSSFYNALLHNKRDGTFEDVSRASGLAGEHLTAEAPGMPSSQLRAVHGDDDLRDTGQ